MNNPFKRSIYVIIGQAQDYYKHVPLRTSDLLGRIPKRVLQIQSAR